MTGRTSRWLLITSLAVFSTVSVLPLAPIESQAQTVEDGSDARIGKADAQTILDLVRQHLNGPDAKVTELRRSEGSVICGSVNVKNRDGLYTGERGFLVDLATRSFGRVPDGPELLSPRSAGFEEKERIRLQYFQLCLD